MLKRFLFVGVAAALAVAGAAWAGDYHSGATLICADCHVMHYSQSHGYNADGSGIYLPVGQGGPFTFMLRDEETRLCLACHNGQAWAPDVFEANTGTAVRLAGALSNTSSNGDYHTADGHTLGSTANAPGGSFSDAEGLTCTDCHHQHGKGNTYRNLQPWDAGTTVTCAVGTNDLTKDVFERTAGVYDISNVDFNEPTQTDAKYGAWCKHCHTDFHGNSQSGNMRNQTEPAGTGWYRHPTADANIGAAGGGGSDLSTFKNRLYRTKVMSASGDWGTQGQAWANAPTDLTPSCFSCHKGHGNKNSFGLIYITGSNPPGEEGDGASVKVLCKQCHRQG